MQRVLTLQKDFAGEKCMIQTYLESRSPKCYFNPIDVLGLDETSLPGAFRQQISDRQRPASADSGLLRCQNHSQVLPQVLAIHGRLQSRSLSCLGGVRCQTISLSYRRVGPTIMMDVHMLDNSS
ncbi:hypothetical protein PsYK624_143710 [Phanerochaete sordida]|uniref:Uncharacterized protein n=1 Tax=Phanerochaete sordida TaxID=48140 RepID=A0A9P3GRM7_9APHY|nr:hypothetical protein PsYK624_143710 [Phanerochaete sordida]